VSLGWVALGWVSFGAFAVHVLPLGSWPIGPHRLGGFLWHTGGGWVWAHDPVGSRIGVGQLSLEELRH
jgi:hypothetical protein